MHLFYLQSNKVNCYDPKKIVSITQSRNVECISVSHFNCCSLCLVMLMLSNLDCGYTVLSVPT